MGSALVKKEISVILEFEHPSEMPVKLMVFRKQKGDRAFCTTQNFSIQYMGSSVLSREHVALIRAVGTIISFNEKKRGLDHGVLSGLKVTTRPMREIITTKRCNQKCIFCNLPPSSNNVVEEPDEIRAVLKEWRRMGIEDIQFGGREATLLPEELKSHISLSKSLGYASARLATNGTRIGSKQCAEEFRDAGLDEVIVSLHSHIPEISARITGKPRDYHKTLKAIEYFLDAGLDVYLSFVLNKINYKSLPEYGVFLADTFGSGGITQVMVSFVSPAFRAWKNREAVIPSITEIKPAIIKFLENNKRTRLNVRIPDYCGIPACTMPQHAHVFEEVDSGNGSGLCGDKLKFRDCMKCSLNQRCSGIWERYVEMYGDSEFAGRHIKELNRILARKSR